MSPKLFILKQLQLSGYEPGPGPRVTRPLPSPNSIPWTTLLWTSVSSFAEWGQEYTYH